jgi:hypothetical protein
MGVYSVTVSLTGGEQIETVRAGSLRTALDNALLHMNSKAAGKGWYSRIVITAPVAGVLWEWRHGHGIIANGNHEPRHPLHPGPPRR